MTKRAQLVHNVASWGHQGSTVESWTVYLGVKEGRVYARVNGTNVMYSETDLNVLASRAVNSDSTYKRPYRFLGAAVHSPGANKPIKGIVAADDGLVEKLTDMVEEKRRDRMSPRLIQRQISYDHNGSNPVGQSRQEVDSKLRSINEEDLRDDGWTRDIDSLGGPDADYYNVYTGKRAKGNDLGLVRTTTQKRVTRESLSRDGWQYSALFGDFYKDGVLKTGRELGLSE